MNPHYYLIDLALVAAGYVISYFVHRPKRDKLGRFSR